MEKSSVASAPEKRVTAGLRGASWNPELLPADMHSAVYPTTTADGAQVIGVLHARGGEKTAVFIMHPRELLISHYMVPYLVKAGYATWVQGPRTVGNDLRLEHELAVHDVAAGVKRLRELGFERIVLLGNSGGASLFAFYNHQASLPPDLRIAHTPGGRPTKLAETELLLVDGFIFIAPHPGQGKLLQNGIDPSVTDEKDPFSVDPALDPFSEENGYRPAADGGASYANEFIQKYRAAQKERVARIDQYAKGLIRDKMEAKKRGKEGGDSYPTKREDAQKAALGAMFNVWRTDADLRCFDLKLDPSDRRFGTVWGADPVVSNFGSVGFARICTPESWLSTWSSLSSNASFDKCGAAITQPALMIYYTGDNTVFPADADAIFATIAAADKQRHSVRGNHHGQPLKSGELIGQDIAAEHILTWLGARFPS
jgi:pimeloyl-ACP methyl ester carboxylesterase